MRSRAEGGDLTTRPQPTIHRMPRGETQRMLPVHAVQALGVADVWSLQRTAGNAAVSSLLRSKRADMKGAENAEEAADAKAKPGAACTAPGVQRNGPDVLTESAKVTLPGSIRASTSPAGMKDRVGLFDTSVSVGVSGFRPPLAPVTLSIEGASAANGKATIDGAETADLTAGATVNIRGTAQTGVGNGGNLRLVAKQGDAELAKSNGFSVSAIPTDYTDTFSSLLKDHRRGFVVQDGWSSDSAGGALADLDGTEISEMVEYGEATGCFAGNAAGSNSSYLPGNKLTKDTHSRGVAELTSPGRLVATQTCMFKDKRSGSDDIPMTRSGYRLTRVVALKASASRGLWQKIWGTYKQSTLQITTSKVGADVTAKGITSAAGSGTIVKRQAVVTGDEI